MNLLAVVPWWGRIAALVGLLAAVMGYGYVKGYLHEERKFNLYQAQVDVLAKDAARRAAERRALQDQNTKEIRDAHAQEVGAIRAYYARRLRDAAHRSVVSAPADGPGEPHGAASQCGPSDEGDDVAMIELEERAALDAAALLQWQDFARRNNFPVR